MFDALARMAQGGGMAGYYSDPKNGEFGQDAGQVAQSGKQGFLQQRAQQQQQNRQAAAQQRARQPQPRRQQMPQGGPGDDFRRGPLPTGTLGSGDWDSGLR